MKNMSMTLAEKLNLWVFLQVKEVDNAFILSLLMNLDEKNIKFCFNQSHFQRIL